MNWVFNLLLVIICSTLVASLSNEDIIKVKNFYNRTKLLDMVKIFSKLERECAPKDVFEEFMYDSFNPCSHHAQNSEDVLYKYYRFTKVEMKVIRVPAKPWMVTLDDDTYFPVPILVMCELSTIKKGVIGYFTLMLLDPELYTFLQVNDYPWGGVLNALAPVNIVNARLLEISYLDEGYQARNFLTTIQEKSGNALMFCEVLRKYDVISGFTYHVSKAEIKIQDYIFYLNIKKKVNVPGVLYCEIEYNANVTKVFKNIVPGTKEVRYYIPNRPVFIMNLSESHTMEFFKAKLLQTEADGKKVLVWI